MVEHPRLVEHGLGHRQRAVRIAGQQHPLGEPVRGAQMDRRGRHARGTSRLHRGHGAERRDIPDALREAVDRTVRATVDTRVRAQDAVDELTGTVDQVVKGAEKNITRSRRTVRAAVEERLPATQDDVKAIRASLRRIGSASTRWRRRAGGQSPARQPRKKAKAKPKSAKTKSKPKR